MTMTPQVRAELDEVRPRRVRPIEDVTSAEFAVSEILVSAKLHVARRNHPDTRSTPVDPAEVFRTAGIRLLELADHPEEW